MNTTMRPFECTFDSIPDYKHFPDVEELHAHSYDLQGRYPDLVETVTIGISQLGTPLILDKINDQNDPEQPRAMYVGSVHANELVGGLTALHTEEELCADSDLRRSLGDCALWAIKTIDPDGYGTQRWRTAEHFTPAAYINGVLRQANNDQVSGGFNRLTANDKTTPEVDTLAMAIRAFKPDFYYPLRSVSFGAGYFLTTPNNYPQLPALFHDELIAIGLRGRDVGDDAFEYNMEGNTGTYEVNPFEAGNQVSDIDYAHAQNDRCFSIIAEVPYFTSDIFADWEDAEYTAGDARKWHRDAIAVENSVMDPIRKQYASDTSVHARTSINRLEVSDPHTPPAVGDRYNGSPVANAVYAKAIVSSLYRIVSLGQVSRAAEMRGDTVSVNAIHQLVDDRLQEVERIAPLRALPIRDLVRAQARAGLHAMQYHFGTLAESS